MSLDASASLYGASPRGWTPEPPSRASSSFAPSSSSRLTSPQVVPNSGQSADDPDTTLDTTLDATLDATAGEDVTARVATSSTSSSSGGGLLTQLANGGRPGQTLLAIPREEPGREADRTGEAATATTIPSARTRRRLATAASVRREELRERRRGFWMRDDEDDGGGGQVGNAGQ